MNAVQPVQPLFPPFLFLFTCQHSVLFDERNGFPGINTSKAKLQLNIMLAVNVVTAGVLLATAATAHLGCGQHDVSKRNLGMTEDWAKRQSTEADAAQSTGQFEVLLRWPEPARLTYPIFFFFFFWRGGRP